MSQSPADLIVFITAALEWPAGPERSRYLDGVCRGDDALRGRVEAFLRAAEASKLLTASAPPRDPGPVPNPPGAPAADPALGAAPAARDAPPDDGPREPIEPGAIRHAPPADGPGSVIGPYKLLQAIGEGGMGTVFMAEQERPIRRKVALKVIKFGMDTRQVVARFEAERQALALMDHPNIARVLDAGATDAGRPYFVMELVRGIPITDYCDRNHLTPRERLELFLPVCRAIQHAHQKGIIHRDIKPNNILVTLHEGAPQPKVIDFGVAKAIERPLTDRTMFTEFGAIIGTLEYMAPEQAELGALDVDTRSDIYSLGVLLYELLTGSTPLEKARLRRAAFAEALRRIREEEPPRPSTRLSDSREALPSISAQRRTEPAKLSRLVRGDLDWIVMKALDKDRTRRYETANGLARDLRRHLDGDAVEASPPSARYRVAKFARKHRAGLGVAAAFAALLLLATATSVTLALRAAAAEKQARLDRDRAQLAQAESRKQAERAFEHEGMAIDAFNRFGDVVRESDVLKGNPVLAPFRRALLAEAQAFFDRHRRKLEADGATDPRSLERLRQANARLADLLVELGAYDEAYRARDRALQIARRSLRDDPSNPRRRAEVAWALQRLAVVPEEAAGRSTPRRLIIEEARQLFDGLAAAEPSVPDHRAGLAATYVCRAVDLERAGRGEESLADQRRARDLYQELHRQHPTSAQYLNRLALTWNNIGYGCNQLKKPEPSMDAHRQAQHYYGELARLDPASTAAQMGLNNAHSCLGMLYDPLGDWKASLGEAREALDGYLKLGNRFPWCPDYPKCAVDTWLRMGRTQRQLNRPDDARSSFREAVALAKRLAQEYPGIDDLCRRLPEAQQALDELDAATGRPR